MNILLIMADELSTWGLGCYDGTLPHTPHLDALAKRGTRFTAAYTPSPMCVPTRAAIACGRSLHEIGYWSSAEAYDGRIPSWGHRLQQANIPVVSIGKLHYRNQTDSTGFDRQIEPIHIPEGIGWVRDLLRKPLCGYAATAELAQMIGPGDSDYIQFDRRVTVEAERWLADPARQARPWCAFVSFLSPHYPLVAPPELFGLYDPHQFEAPPEPLPDHPILSEIGAFFSHDAHFTPETRGIASAAYFGLCSFLDAQVGRVLAALEASGQADETLILFTSDHGEMLGRKGLWGKYNMYDDAARVPLIISGPGVGTAKVHDDPVSLIDLAPTISAAAGLPNFDQSFSGRSLLAPPQPDRTVISEYHDGGCSVGITMVRWNDSAGAWKYVHYSEGHPPQLFNLSQDPNETNDLAAHNPVILSEARRRMAQILDPEDANSRAHADQARMVEKLGGREKLLAAPQWNFTPADSR
ncbi:MAG TPA: sulfatase-like hydrolase/transferase [Thermohalobaculum sp.]|nr:sulfatase-like hydrolase/transferase [Thermohalobaculum sp.]